MKKSLVHVAVLCACIVLITGSGFAASYTVNNTDSGWYDQSGFNGSGNTNYSAGNHFNNQLNDYFSFSLAGVSGPVTAATFNVYSYNVFLAGTYSIYGTNLSPAGVGGGCGSCVSTFTALASGSAIGSINVTTADSNSWLTITLNSAGLSWLTANEGNGIVLGGAFPQPANGGDNDLFGYSGFNGGNNLAITTGTPEPGTLIMFGSGILGLAGIAPRKFLL
jgi:hypothetical protein